MTNRSAVQALLPVRYAESLTRCHLYWIPAARFPLPSADRIWILELLRMLAAFQQQQSRPGPEVFIRQDTVLQNFVQPFMDDVLELRPLLGFPRQPGQTLKRTATEADIEDFRNGKQFVLEEWFDYYCYWLLGGDRQATLQKYFGAGGMSVVWLKDAGPPPAQTKIPKFLANHPDMKPVLQRFPLQAQLQAAAALRHPFLKKSFEYFGQGLSTLKMMENIPFILPVLTSSQFFSLPEDYLKHLFELFEVYITESPADGGVILASSTDLTEPLAAIVAQLQQAGLLPRHSRD